jgi:hypothetical protein
MPTCRFAIGKLSVLLSGRANVSWRAEYRVVGYIRPGNREVRWASGSRVKLGEFLLLNGSLVNDTGASPTLTPARRL